MLDKFLEEQRRRRGTDAPRTPTMQTEVRRLNDGSDDALSVLMQARPCWRAASSVLYGSFCPEIASIVSGRHRAAE